LCNKKTGDYKEAINSNRAAIDLTPGELRNGIGAFTTHQVERMRKYDQRGEKEAQKIKVVRPVTRRLLSRRNHKH
jgi:hypothetical protein